MSCYSLFVSYLGLGELLYKEKDGERENWRSPSLEVVLMFLLGIIIYSVVFEPEFVRRGDLLIRFCRFIYCTKEPSFISVSLSPVGNMVIKGNSMTCNSCPGSGEWKIVRGVLFESFFPTVWILVIQFRGLVQLS